MMGADVAGRGSWPHEHALPALDGADDGADVGVDLPEDFSENVELRPDDGVERAGESALRNSV
jgi:hypothetical protein